MANKNKRAWGICDVCGFRYKHRDLKKNSYNLLVCPTDWEGQYDRKNHPQNFAAKKTGDDIAIKDVRQDLGGRNAVWEDTNLNWEDLDEDWNTV
jgi:hypothetical protein